MNADVPALPPRLAAIAEEVAPGSRVADIGTDHGLLPLWLAATGRAAYCLATEKTRTTLSRAARPVPGAPGADRLAYRAGDGLFAIAGTDRIDTIVLAGLGGRTIVRILAAKPPASPPVSRLVLQPRSEAARVRAWLSRAGWRVAAECLAIERGRAHVTIAAERGSDVDLYGHETLSVDDLLAAGPVLVRSEAPEVAALWEAERDRLIEIGASAAAGPGISRARADLARAERILAAISRRAG